MFGSAAGIADRQIVFGAMAGRMGAFASRFATADVAFDERASQKTWADGNDPFEEDRASSSKGRGFHLP